MAKQISLELVLISEVKIKAFEERNEDKFYLSLKIGYMRIASQGIHEIETPKIKVDLKGLLNEKFRKHKNE